MSILFWIGYGDTYMPLLTILLYMFLWKRIQYREFVILLYSVFWICNIIFLEPLNSFNTTSAGITNLVILFLCMYYLLNLSKEEEILYFQKLPSFWIVSAFLIYSALSLLIFISYAYFINSNMNKEGSQIWAIISIATIIKFVLISVGLLCYKRRPSLPRILLL